MLIALILESIVTVGCCNDAGGMVGLLCRFTFADSMGLAGGDVIEMGVIGMLVGGTMLSTFRGWLGTVLENAGT